MAQGKANDSGHDAVVPTHSNLQLSQFQRDLHSSWTFCDEIVDIQDQFFSIRSIFLQPSYETVVADMD